MPLLFNIDLLKTNYYDLTIYQSSVSCLKITYTCFLTSFAICCTLYELNVLKYTVVNIINIIIINIKHDSCNNSFIQFKKYSAKKYLYVE